jgi:hypothetical protein
MEPIGVIPSALKFWESPFSAQTKYVGMAFGSFQAWFGVCIRSSNGYN